MPQRSYYLPGGTATVTSLNGIWNFAFFENGDRAGEPTEWKPIEVPSCWPAYDPLWKKEMLERMRRAFERDKNHCSIIMWSTGNESQHGPNHVAMIDWLHSQKDGRLVHCEDASRKETYAAEADPDCANRPDVYSRMYLSPGEMDGYGTLS